MATSSIKVAIPRDIQDFEARVIGPLTKRQAVLFIISLAIGFVFFQIFGLFKMELALQIILSGFFVTPLLACGWVKMLGMPLEVYFLKCVLPALLSKNTRPYMTVNKCISKYSPEPTEEKIKETEKDRIRRKLLLKKYDVKE